ncbi:hypothetical protein ACJIZ3_025452 [Penstemon smallii]|uniref:Uncharacterized protein n=1 Tax=Penstemon smallii TaxID=265156 RepID=A0ABD3TUN7_9LAMI
MEQNLPIVAKKFWNIVRVMYLMLRKGISKGKLLSDVNTMMKRGKIAGKAAIHNLMFHLQLNEYQFSCSNTGTPAFHLPFHLNNNNNKKKRKKQHLPTDAVLMAAAFDIINNNNNSVAASPALPGFGPSPMVRQLRITDSPFPLMENDQVDNTHVDEAAEQFIIKFYKDLKRQN